MHLKMENKEPPTCCWRWAIWLAQKFRRSSRAPGGFASHPFVVSALRDLLTRRAPIPIAPPSNVREYLSL
jgi:hypothetical protein